MSGQDMIWVDRHGARVSTNGTKYETDRKYLLANPARQHADDLLEALQAVDQMFDLPGKINKSTVRDKVRAAIAKATGRAS